MAAIGQIARVDLADPTFSDFAGIFFFTHFLLVLGTAFE